MRFRRLTIGGVEVLLGIPEAWGDRLATLRATLTGARKRNASAPTMATPPATGLQLEKRVRAHPWWYHTIDLGGGVVTPGFYDHRRYLREYRIAERLDGLRVLDVATYDGFWAFEFERRGAAEVVAVDVGTEADLDLPPRIRAAMPLRELARSRGSGFALCHEALGSQVRREVLSVYELSPERLGTFDFVFVGDLLLHLTNPVKALENLCRVTRGSAIIAEAFHPSLPGELVAYEGGTLHCTWWWLGFGALEHMVRDAGFTRVDLMNRMPIWKDDRRPGGRPWRWRAVFRATP